nr:hypothetical protein [Tanacetum cinerariifolium]
MTKTINEESQMHARVDGKEIIITESSVGRDIHLTDEDGVYCLPNSTVLEYLELMRYKAVYKEMADRLVRAATTASGLEAEQDSGNIDKTQSKETHNKASFLRTTSGGGLRCQEAMRDTIAQTRFENVSKLSNDSLLAREQQLAREKAQKELEANIALQAKIDVNYQMVERLKESRKKRNKPPTQAQQRKVMCTYLKNIEGKKLKDLKKKSFDSIQKMFDKAFNKVNTFIGFKTELDEGSLKRAGEELTQERSKKQKVDDDKETSELKKLMEIIPNEEDVVIDAIPLAFKSPKSVHWKIHKEGKKSYY